MRLSSSALVTFALTLSAAGLPVTDAAACGMFVGPRDPTVGIPSIDTEQVLIVHDSEKNREHFVREVRFANAKGKLGFLVPVPSLPEIAKEAAPFEALGKAFPFQPPLPKLKPRRPGSKGGGSADGIRGMGSSGVEGGAAEPPPVELLAAKKVGSFTAFTLTARDPVALTKWLTDNGLEAPPSHQKWLAHYVKLGFFFVAFRFDGSDDDLVAETVRVSFDTPVPYYPYLEPFQQSSPRGGRHSRLLRSWVVTDTPVSPLAIRAGRGGMSNVARLTPVTPWGVGSEYNDRATIERALGPALAKSLPKRAVLQTYADTRLSRNGYGDILFVPRAKTAASPEQRQRWEPLLPLLEPTLVEGDMLVSVEP